MVTAIDLDLDENNSGITFSGTYGPGVKIKYELQNGDSVTLKKGGIDIEVSDTQKQENGQYIGIVKYVDPYKSLESEGVDEGVDIVFDYKNIFACFHA